MSAKDAAALELATELLLIGLRRLAEYSEAVARMRAGGEAVSAAEVKKAGLEADAAIAAARAEINAAPF